MSTNTPRYVKAEYQDDFGNSIVAVGEVYEDNDQRLKLLQKKLTSVTRSSVYTFFTIDKRVARGLVTTDL